MLEGNGVIPGEDIIGYCCMHLIVYADAPAISKRIQTSALLSEKKNWASALDVVHCFYIVTPVIYESNETL